MDIETCRAYCDCLQQRLKEAGITESRLAQAMGYTGPAALSRWLNHRQGMRRDTIDHIEAALRRLQEAQ